MKFDEFKKNEKTEAEDAKAMNLEVYEEDEIDMLEEYICKQYGEFENVFHEIFSPDIHVDIAIVPPNENQDYYTLITMGMGAHKMNVPEELSEYNLDRAELVTYLPKDWKLDSDEEIWYWPLRWLKILSRLPIEQDTWLGFGHTVPSGEPVAEDVSYNCFMLIDDASTVVGTDKTINFYTMLPLYEEEMHYKIDNGAEALLSLFEQKEIPYPPVIDKQRKNVCSK
ncbi:MAG: suppressor of fused domain protein [Eubacterium sp.]|nr:suppressor of fused domain protein [Eubacterium sp.]